MLVVVAALLASYIPSVLFFLWLRSLHKDDEEYKKICGRVLRSGMLSVFPVALASFILNILMVLVLKDTVPVLVREAIYNFLVIANAEEMVK